MHAHVRHLT
ncbi:hypothetical protein XACG115_1190096 [Xanthomonas citri pv. citri]|nr:hypothetical protein XACG115_1190096 [Xanthomonas citri pv. citri]